MRRVLAGSVGAPGTAYGTIFRLPGCDRTPIGASDTEAPPIERFQKAQREVAAYFNQLSAELHAEGKPIEAAIFDGQALLASDPAFAAEVARRLEANMDRLPEAVRATIDSLAATLSATDDSYLRERADDVRAVGQQILAVLSGTPIATVAPAGAIVIARDLMPSQIVLLRKQAIAGAAIAGGTATGHSAILARGLGLPLVVGLGADVLAIPDGTEALLLADEGRLLVAPDEAEHRAYQMPVDPRRADAPRRQSLRTAPAQTGDGHQVVLWANIGHPDEAQQALDYGAEGVGLFRTEFLFLGRATPPSEDEQYQAYIAALRTMSGRPVVIRTLDIGGDKLMPYLPPLAEANPFLGWRGIRFAMRFHDLFQIQLRALLRAACAGNLHVMLPLVTTPADVVWARQELAVAADALAAAKIPHRADVPLGIMVETPAMALTLDLLPRDIRFCSIGSNDLAQYTLAVDRGATDLAERYQPDSPAVWRIIRNVVRDARRLGLELSICGELAAQPEASIALVGLGVEKLSVTPAALLGVKEALRAVSLTEAQAAAGRACGEHHVAAGDTDSQHGHSGAA